MGEQVEIQEDITICVDCAGKVVENMNGEY